jgi:4-diphosphocytidyl-2-C-methyl-D-erythritol kinase
MIVFPCAKINLGLNIVGKLENGYHSLETFFYPIPIYDALEIKYMDERFPGEEPCDLKVTGNQVDCDEQSNLVIQAYHVLAEDFSLPRVHAHLYKQIPSKAGLGGGSSDGAFMIRLLDERFRLNIGNPEMERYAAKLGADCAFFITAEPSFGSGMGNLLEPADGPKGNLSGYYLAVVKPDISISTSDAFRQIKCQKPMKCCREVVRQPIDTWKTDLVNDFEKPVFSLWPELKDIKQHLYDRGAVYAQMSGSGSAVYGIFRQKPLGLEEEFRGSYIAVRTLE